MRWPAVQLRPMLPRHRSSFGPGARSSSCCRMAPSAPHLQGAQAALRRDLKLPSPHACRAPKLRTEVARVLRARNAPHLVFRRDAPTAKQVGGLAAT